MMWGVDENHGAAGCCNIVDCDDMHCSDSARFGVKTGNKWLFLWTELDGHRWCFNLR